MPPIDLRNVFPAALDQGKRGTCIAFATTAAHEYFRLGRIGAFEDLSEEALHFGCKAIENDNESGTSFQAANQVLTDLGQPPEALWVYDKLRDEKRRDCPPPADSINPEFCFRASFTRLASGSKEIMRMLERGVPVIVGIPLRASFHFAISGRVPMPSPLEMFVGNHALLIVGWEAGADGEPSLIFRNSWGERWGDNGYGYLKAEYMDRFGCQAYCFDPL